MPDEVSCQAAMDSQHRARRCPNQRFSRAADPQPIPTGTPFRAHYDQARVRPRDGLFYARNRITIEQQRLD